MRCNILKVLLVFSALLIFALPGELAAQTPDDIVLLPETATLALEGDEDFTARLTSSGTGVEEEWVYFWLSPGLGVLNGTDGGWVLTDESGYAPVEYEANTTSGTDTLFVYWTDEWTRVEYADTSIITINPGPATSLNITPEVDTHVVVTDDVVLVTELWDDFLNHVNATSPSQVSFSTSGLGTFGTASVNGDGCIECAYTTDDSMVYYAPDTITVELLVNETKDFTNIYTYGGAPATMNIYADDSTVFAGGIVYGWYYSSDYYEDFWFYVVDQYGNPSVWSDWYDEDLYAATFTVGTGGGEFYYGTVSVDESGWGADYYLSDTVAVVRTVTGTCGAATDDIDITQIPDWPDELVLTPDSIGIPASTDTVLTATMFDSWGNHCDADDERFGGLSWGGWTAKDDGDLGGAYVEDHNWKNRYYSYEYAADTAWIWVWLPMDIRSKYSDTVVVFSAEPGDFHHYDIDVVLDSANVSDGNIYQSDVVRIEAQDANNIRLYTYSNPDTVTLSLVGSTAGESQVVWYLNPPLLTPTAVDDMAIDTLGVGTNAFVPGGTFNNGLLHVGITNQIAETVPVTATDTAGHTGISPAITWLPIEVVGFDVQLEGGIDTIETYDTVNVEVTAIDEFGNTTDVGLPLNIVLSANRTGVVFPAGATHLMENSVELYPTVATAVCSGLEITVADILSPGINGSSDPIEVIGVGIAEGPVVSNISAAFGSGEILYSVADDGEVSIKVYNKAGMEVGTLVDGVVKSGYYQASLKGLNLSSDVYFVVMKGPGIDKSVKTALIK